MQFAEFLNHGYLIHLSILYLPTCVGLGYGRCESSLADFLGSSGSMTSSYSTRHRVSASVGNGFAYAPAYALTPGQPSPGFTYHSSSLHCWPLRSGSFPFGPLRVRTSS